MRKYCPNCNNFRDLESGSRQHPKWGALTPQVLEDEDGDAKYGCYCSLAWGEPMPMRVIDIQLLRAVECGSFIERSEQ
jgi:pyruvate-formate lyase-activating enzyme